MVREIAIMAIIAVVGIEDRA
jgi:hypothetical protein